MDEMTVATMDGRSVELRVASMGAPRVESRGALTAGYLAARSGVTLAALMEQSLVGRKAALTVAMTAVRSAVYLVD